MKTADFDFELPPELIAQHPAPRREHSRMLVVRRQAGILEHRHFSDLPQYLNEGDLLVVNNTRVIPARVFGRKPGTGGKVEILLLEEIRPGTWDILLHASRRPKVGSLITLGDGQAVAILLSDGEKGRATIKIESERPWLEVLEEIGVPPLPPYIKRSEIRDRRSDAERYQTVYAKYPGAVAAPTAGLHFTDEIFQTLETQGVKKAEITLHVGLGTFRPVDAENVEDHRMEAERYTVPAETAKRIEETKAGSGRIVAVGSTTRPNLGNRRRRARPRDPMLRPIEPVYSSAVFLQGGGCDADEFPSAEVHADHDGVRAGGSTRLAAGRAGP